MFPRLRLAAVIVAALAGTQAARAAPIDVQFSGTFSYVCGYPCAYYSPLQTGAAVVGSAGDQWNEFFASAASNQALLDTSGGTTGVTLTFAANGAYTSAPTYDAFQGTPWANLMLGYLVNNISMTLSGLTPGGSYDMYVYAQGDNNSAGRAIGLTATGGSTATATQTNTNTFIQNNNYVLLQPIADAFGTIFIQQFSGTGETNVNGFQLVSIDVPEPAGATVLGIALLGLAGLTRKFR